MLFSVRKIKSKQISKRKSLRNARSENERKTGVFRPERAELFQKKHRYGYFYKLLENSGKGALCRAPHGIKISRKNVRYGYERQRRRKRTKAHGDAFLAYGFSGEHF